MEAHVKWFWIVTAANVVVAVLAVPLVAGVMLALVGFASFNNSLPPFVLPVIGMGLSISGIILSKKVGTPTAKRVRLAVHSSAMALHITILLGIAALFAMHRG
jgi:hypothetical protein